MLVVSFFSPIVFTNSEKVLLNTINFLWRGGVLVFIFCLLSFMEGSSASLDPLSALLSQLGLMNRTLRCIK